MTDGSPGSDFLIATTPTGDLQVWDLLAARGAISIGAAHSDEITTAKWAPDGKQIVSVGKDASICVWNTASERSAERSGQGGARRRARCVCGRL